MLCAIIDIRGDYAFVKYEDTGMVSEVAIALLPIGVEVGDLQGSCGAGHFVLPTIVLMNGTVK